MTHMTPAEVAAQDQVHAFERDRAVNVDARIRAVLWALVGLYAAAGAYVVVAIVAGLPVAPWSPVGLSR